MLHGVNGLFSHLEMRLLHVVVWNGKKVSKMIICLLKILYICLDEEQLIFVRRHYIACLFNVYNIR